LRPCASAPCELEPQTQGVLLVDGYNCIHAWQDLRKLADTVDLAAARDRLCHILAEYAGASRLRIIVVFDAYQTERTTPTARMTSGIEVIFTKKGMTADAYIERLAEELDTRNYTVQVATSDAAEQSMVLGNGAARLSARELRLRCRLARESQENYLEKRNVAKPNTLEHTLPRSVVEKLKEAAKGEK